MIYPEWKRLKNQIDRLADFNSEPEMPGTTRLFLSDAEMEARDYVIHIMKEAHLNVSIDSAANIHGILPGSNPQMAPVWSGSHIDTVLCAGRYDGMLGVLGAIEACRIICEEGLTHKRNIEVLVYSSEEPIRFGVGCIGSRALSGHLTCSEMKNLRDKDGITLYDLLVSRGYDADAVPRLKKSMGDVFASVELHIEQAEVLENEHIPIGIVTGICAPSYMQVTVKGIQRHAGATAMTIRKDALCAAAEMLLRIERLAAEQNHPNAVATVGKLNVFPNASNVIPGQVDFSIDIRDYLAERKEGFIKRIQKELQEIAENRGVEIQCRLLASDTPSVSDPKLVRILEEICLERGIPFKEMISGAYHDTMFAAEFSPTAMIFVPSKNGISHDPAEYTEPDDIVRGVCLLTESLRRLANTD